MPQRFSAFIPGFGRDAFDFALDFRA